jgi:hypothetical protein
MDAPSVAGSSNATEDDLKAKVGGYIIFWTVELILSLACVHSSGLRSLTFVP